MITTAILRVDRAAMWKGRVIAIAIAAVTAILRAAVTVIPRVIRTAKTTAMRLSLICQGIVPGIREARVKQAVKNSISRRHAMEKLIWGAPSPAVSTSAATRPAKNRAKQNASLTSVVWVPEASAANRTARKIVRWGAALRVRIPAPRNAKMTSITQVSAKTSVKPLAKSGVTPPATTSVEPLATPSRRVSIVNADAPLPVARVVMLSWK